MAKRTIFRVDTGKGRPRETFHVSRTPSGGKVVTVKPETHRRALAAAADAAKDAPPQVKGGRGVGPEAGA